MSYDGESAAPTHTGHSFQLHVGYNRSPSRGAVRARAPLPNAGAGSHPPPPEVQFNYMSTEDDWAGFRAALRISRELVGQPAFDHLRGAEISPGPAVQTDAQIDDYLAEHLESAYHPCATCKMGGADDAAAVVDGRGRVRGVASLRVVDASIFPTIPNGNLNAPTIMCAEKIADDILGLPPLQPIRVEMWADPEWRTRQRERPPARRLWESRSRVACSMQQ